MTDPHSRRCILVAAAERWARVPHASAGSEVDPMLKLSAESVGTPSHVPQLLSA